MLVSPEVCAWEVLEVVPLIMQAIRAHVRSQRGPELSVPQFRTLAFLNRCPGASLSEVAEHIGLTRPSMSKLIDGLVTRHLVSREISPVDRRCVRLILTPAGQTALQSARQATQIYLAQLLAELPDSEQATIIGAMQTLRPVFSPDSELEIAPEIETKNDS